MEKALFDVRHGMKPYTVHHCKETMYRGPHYCLNLAAKVNLGQLNKLIL